MIFLGPVLLAVGILALCSALYYSDKEAGTGPMIVNGGAGILLAAIGVILLAISVGV